jgi:uncharacterized protein (TIGR02147 family)
VKHSRLNIYAYQDYATYLSDYYASQKLRLRSFSFRSFAARAEVAPSLLKDIIERRRKLTLDVMAKYALAMGLSQKETQYFELLVHFVNEKKTGAKIEKLADLTRARKGDFIRTIEHAKYEFFSKWYHSAVRELITLKEFQDDPAWIAGYLRPTITATQAKASLDLLMRLGLIQRDAQGKWVQYDAVISSEAEIQNLALRTFNEEMLRLAKESLDRFPLESREASTLTLGVSRSCYQNLKKRIRDFKLQLLTMVVEDKEPAQIVCQANFQLFPLIDGDAVKDVK